MITTKEQAFKVQARRRESGKKGRSKAVRRWFKREHGAGIEAHAKLPEALKRALDGNFQGCRNFKEAHFHDPTT